MAPTYAVPGLFDYKMSKDRENAAEVNFLYGIWTENKTPLNIFLSSIETII